MTCPIIFALKRISKVQMTLMLNYYYTKYHNHVLSKQLCSYHHKHYFNLQMQ